MKKPFHLETAFFLLNLDSKFVLGFGKAFSPPTGQRGIRLSTKMEQVDLTYLPEFGLVKTWGFAIIVARFSSFVIHGLMVVVFV